MRYDLMRIWTALLLCFTVSATSSIAQSQTQVSDAQAELAQAIEDRGAGLYGAAIDRLRDLVRRFPADNGLREELGYTLILDKQFASAQYQFQLLAERSADPQRRALYRAVLQRILSDRPAGVSLVFEIVPSSNINRGADTDRLETAFGVFRITDESQARSGWRRTLGLEGFFRTAVSGRDQIILNWDAVNTNYSDDILPELTDLGAALTWRRLTDTGHVQITLGQSRIRTGQERIRQNDVEFAGGRVLRAGNSRFDWSIARSDLAFEMQPERSGPLVSASMRHTWLLENARSVFIGAILEDNTPTRPHQQYDGVVLQVGGRAQVFGGTLVDVTLSLGQRDFRGVFPGQTFSRRDTFQELGISAQDSRVRFQGFTPRATCTLRANNSNVSLFDATTRECGIALTRRF